jgi:hypothetical protein
MHVSIVSHVDSFSYTTTGGVVYGYGWESIVGDTVFYNGWTCDPNPVYCTNQWVSVSSMRFNGNFIGGTTSATANANVTSYSSDRPSVYYGGYVVIWVPWGSPPVTVNVSGSVSASISISFSGYRNCSTNPPPPPPSTATLTVQLYRVDAGGNSLGPAAGAQVRVGGTTYTADSQGRVSVQVQQGSTVSVEVLQTTLSSGWQRYTFWRWGDGSTSNPRSFTASSSTTVTAYV